MDGSNAADWRGKSGSALDLARFFEISADAFAIAGFDGYFHAVNQSFVDLFGFAEEELRERPYVTFVHPDDRDAVVAEVRSLVDQGGCFSFQCRFADARGSYRHMSWTASGDSEHELFYAIGRDVTDDMLREGELRSANARLEAARREAQLQANRYNDLLNNSSEMIYTVTLDGVYLEVNRATARSYGLEVDDVIGRNVSDLLDIDYNSAELQEFQARVAERGRLRAQPMRITTAQGEVAWLEASHRMLYDDEGQPYAIQSIARNVTERRNAERSLRDLNRQLQEKTDEALELASQAQASARAKAEFLANMSHEIRTPMNGVVGMTDLLLQTDLDPEQRDFVETIRSSADALLTVIGDVLDFSKLEARKLTFQDTDFDLRDVMEDVAGLLAPEAHRKDVEFVLQLTPPEFRSVLRGDPGRLRQVLVNLVGNAVKFTERGEVGLYASVLSEDERWASIRIEVTDTGIGIAEEAQGSIFDSFTQVDGGAARRFGGTGLGLAISKQIVDLLGGSISVRSNPGEGSTFTVELRYDRRAASDDELDAGGLVGKRVMVVDDNETNRRILVQQLETWGVLPVAVRSGREALSMLRVVSEFDLILMDMQMPEMDGEETTARIRSEMRLTEVPVVLLSSGFSLTAEESRSRGFTAALLKPVRMSTLFDTVCRIVSPESDERVAAERGPGGLSLGYRVLLAEDNPINQKVAVALLKRWDCEVTVVSDGKQAVDILRERKFDVVLMDCHMPVMDGYQATAAVRAFESHAGRHTPIVAMTANALQGDRERCITSGMDDYVPKPVKPDVLHAALTRWAGGAPEAAAVAPAMPLVIFDQSHLIESCGDDDELANELAAEFLEQCSSGLAQLNRLIIAHDGAGLKHEAHRLKGSCLAVGAFALGRRMADLEAAALAEDFPGADALLSSANLDFIATNDAMFQRAAQDAA
jgi:PAS domain S-box-containing protein